jgi:hypothetical protein
MNQRSPSLAPGPLSAAALDARQARFALRLTARLTEHSMALDPDLSERLRFARETALDRARAVRAAERATDVRVSHGGAALLAGNGPGWWLKFASALPVLALVAGLVLIQRWQDDTQIAVAAEVDAALLADDLPPRAYSDAGFVEFLKAPDE